MKCFVEIDQGRLNHPPTQFRLSQFLFSFYFMKNRESLTNIEREKEFIQTLFNFSHFQETNPDLRINQILPFFQNSKNGPNYLINLIDYYPLCRPQHSNICKLFVENVFLSFPKDNRNIFPDSKSTFIAVSS